MGVELEQHLLHHPAECSTFILQSLSCVVVFARATVLLQLSVSDFCNTKNQHMNHYRIDEPSESYRSSCQHTRPTNLK